MNDIDFVNAILAARSTSHMALERIMPEIKALDPAKVRTVNMDLPSGVARVLGALPRLLALQQEIEQQTPLYRIDKLKKLETYAYATQEAYVRCLCDADAPDELRALATEGDAVRDVLLSDANALGARGLIKAARLASCTGAAGYKVIATELGVLSAVLQESWPQIKGKCAVTEAELKRARAIADALLAFAGQRELSPEATAVAIDIRNRAFTLMYDNYDQARRVATYICWGRGDVDEVAPALYAGKRRSRATDEEQPVDPAAPTNPTPAPGTVPGSNTAQPTDIQVGRPNSNPFMP